MLTPAILAVSDKRLVFESPFALPTSRKFAGR
jgi:hypothetical protein